MQNPVISESHESEQKHDTSRKTAVHALKHYMNLSKEKIFQRTEVASHTDYCMLKTEISQCEDKY